MRFHTFSSKAGLVIVLLLSLTAVLSSPVYAAAPIAKISDIINVFHNIIQLLAPAAAIAFLLMFLVGGFKFVTSGGDPKAAASARSTLTYAVIGIVLVVGSWLILQLVGQLTGTNITEVNFTP